MKYQHIAHWVYETPWALLPSRLMTITELINLRVAGETLTDEQIAQRIGTGPKRSTPQPGGAVAVIPIHGVIIPRAEMFAESSGAVSIERIRAMFRAALGDASVESILLDVDSPGGSVDQVPEMADEIYQARRVKQITSISNGLAASAGYWLAVAAGEMSVTPSGQAGSIGVWAAHDNISKAMEMQGVQTTLVSAGKYKVEGNPLEPLSDEARTHIQSVVNSYYGMFTRDVARFRGTTVEAVRNGYGEGRVLPARTALDAGMVDQIETFDAALGRLLAAGRAPNGSRAETVPTLGYVSVSGAVAEPASTTTGAASTIETVLVTPDLDPLAVIDPAESAPSSSVDRRRRRLRLVEH